MALTETLPTFPVHIPGSFLATPGRLHLATAYTGSDQVSLNAATLEIQTTAQTSATFIGASGKLVYTGIGGFGGAGHMVGSIGWTVVNAPSYTVGLAIGTEGKVSVNGGNVTSLTLVEANLDNVAAGSFVGTVSAVHQFTANHGTITTLRGHRCRPTPPGQDPYGTITTVEGLLVETPNAGVNVNTVGMRITDSATPTTKLVALESAITKTGTGRYTILTTGDAPSHHLGEVRIGTNSNVSGTECFLLVTGRVGILSNPGDPAGATAGLIKLYGVTDTILRCMFPNGSTVDIATAP